jgi:hypothetical protein
MRQLEILAHAIQARVLATDFALSSATSQLGRLTLGRPVSQAMSDQRALTAMASAR